ncbi:hypothetical protein JW756_05720 [Candidatus Woesearchaeota archaeon]|nr:hypothetical protein [Candidatus Woesearchaeota archaeon]
MGIEEKLKQAQIKRLLVVDDTNANIDAAKKFFSTIEPYGVKIDYATNVNDAKALIRESIRAPAGVDNRYSLILSDLSMEEPESGFEVIKEGIRHFTYGFIVTGRNRIDQSHGPKTIIKPKCYGIRTSINEILGTKDDVAVWEKVFSYIMDYITINEGKNLFRALSDASKKLYVDDHVDSLAYDGFAENFVDSYYYD